MVIPSGLLADVVAHAQRVAPDECCELSILEWACSLPADCFAKKQKLQKK